MTAIDCRALVVGPAIRRVPRRELGGVLALCSVPIVVWATKVDAVVEMIPAIRIMSVLCAAAAAMCLDDPGEAVLDAAPFGPVRRRTMAMLLMGCAAMLGWWVLVAGGWLVAGSQVGGVLPVGGLAIEFVVLCLLGWLLAIVRPGRSSERGGGTLAAATLVLMALMSISVPRLIGWFWAMPGPHWSAAHRNWLYLGALVSAALVVSNRDPASRLPYPRGASR
jgi:hypothetical protein